MIFYFSLFLVKLSIKVIKMQARSREENIWVKWVVILSVIQQEYAV